MTRHMLYTSDTGERQGCTIEVSGIADDLDVNIKASAGHVDVVRWGSPDHRASRGLIGNMRYENPPPWRLTGYLVDGEIAPDALNAWVDAVLSASGCGASVDYSSRRVPPYIWYRGGLSEIANSGDLVHCMH